MGLSQQCAKDFILTRLANYDKINIKTIKINKNESTNADVLCVFIYIFNLMNIE